MVLKDFDEALKADKKEELQIKVCGKEYTLPATLPARTVLAQIQYASQETVPLEVMPEWIASLVGKDNFNQMLDDGISWDQMNELLVYLLEFYGLSGAIDTVAGETDKEDGDEDSPK